MKYKALGLGACLFMLLIGLFDWRGQLGLPQRQRYQQHLDAPKKESCTAPHKEGELCSHLPLLCIDTGGQVIPGAKVHAEDGTQTVLGPNGEDRIDGRLRVVDHDTAYNHPTDAPTLESQMVIHVRGNTSRHFPKLGYRIKLVDGNGNANPQPLLGMDTHHEWALHGPYLDKTLIRNYMFYNLAGQIMDYAPNVRFCEVLINGEYMGVYVLTELIGEGQDGGRLDLEVSAKNHFYTGYLLRLDRHDGSEVDWLRSLTTYTYRNDPDLKLEVEFPTNSKLTPKIRKSIKEDFSRFEKALYSYDYDNPRYGYRTFIDVDSFAAYLLIHELSVNYDAGAYSTYIYKDTGKKLKMCVWDFNNACDNYQQQSFVQVQHFELHNKLWFGMLIKDADFVEAVIQKYFQLRRTVFREDYLMDYIDGVVEYLGPAIDRNFEKWGSSFEDDTLLEPAERNLHSYEEAIAQLKDFLRTRGRWMDENIQSLRQYCATSKTKKYNEVTE